MIDPFGDASRRRIRAELYRHMKTDRVSARQIAAFIKSREDDFRITVSEESVKRFLDPEAGKVADSRVAALQQYLEIRRAAPSITPPPRLGRSASTFRALRTFFAMTDEKARQFSEKITGIWSFYAFSEGGSSSICRGAIEFTVDDDGEFHARELQKSVPVGTTDAIYERYVGHFVFRRDSMIIVLREQVSSIAKFYILSIPAYDSEKGRKIIMFGSFVKMGSYEDVFSTKAYFVRNDAAFDECDVVPACTLPTIKKRLD